ncbi:S1C family serine protease [Thermorudis peleae]|uniref:S1C family serine protease n=1 Tax=Thermorudis peleae TaxID=1382356 RepID=UPI000690D6F5|nr:serine protease [Thermorudis peleae]
MRLVTAGLTVALVIIVGGLVAGGLLLSRAWGPAPAPPTLDPRVQLTVTPLATPVGTQTSPNPTPKASTPGTTPTAGMTPTALSNSTNPARSALAGVVQVRTPNGQGTGFAWQQQGTTTRILTAAHVIADAPQVRVITPDGQEHPAHVLRVNEHADVALLEANDTGGLRPLPLGSAAVLEPGDPLYVVGYALGADLLGDPTVTRGVLSGRRVIDGVACLQTDAAMNPGNSGGPVLNERGEVVGIAAWGVRERAGVTIQGVNFAVTIEQARDALGLP